jgi:hypothetical protein
MLQQMAGKISEEQRTEGMRHNLEGKERSQCYTCEMVSPPESLCRVCGGHGKGVLPSVIIRIRLSMLCHDSIWGGHMTNPEAGSSIQRALLLIYRAAPDGSLVFKETTSTVTNRKHDKIIDFRNSIDRKFNPLCASMRSRVKVIHERATQVAGVDNEDRENNT